MNNERVTYFKTCSLPRPLDPAFLRLQVGVVLVAKLGFDDGDFVRRVLAGVQVVALVVAAPLLQVHLDRHFAEVQVVAQHAAADTAGTAAETPCGSLQISTIVGGCTPTCVA